MSRSLQQAISEDLIENEFYRQRDLKRKGKFRWTLDEVRYGGRRISDAEKLAVLAEEFGEVSHIVCDGLSKTIDRSELEKELVELATCCLAWIEAIRYHEGSPLYRDLEE
jgi:hypothetical protein